MRNAEQIRKRLDDIKQMKSYTEALTALADVQYEIGIEACHERAELKKEVDRLRAIILGNGDPEHSLMNRMSLLEAHFEDIKNDVIIIKDAIIGDLKGKKGLLDRMEESEKINANLVKLMWIIVGVVVSAIVTMIIGLI